MATLPDYVLVLLADFSDGFDPSVQRTEMTRGPAKQTILNSQVLCTVQATLYFRSRADANSFEDWYFNTINRIGWFDWYHPRLARTVSARFPSGNIGTLTPSAGRFAKAKRQVAMEFYQ